MQIRTAVIVFVVKDGRVLLAEKLDKIGKGKLNGYGGKPNEGESFRSAACREFKEETGGAIVLQEDLEQAALTWFCNENEDNSRVLWKIPVYIVRRYSGFIKETKEMGKPEWFSIHNPPVQRMLPADRYWFPRVLRGKQVFVRGTYGPGLKTVIDIEVNETKFLLDW